MVTVILIEIARLLMTGILLGIGFAIVRAVEDWINGKRLMANQELMQALARG